MKKRNSNSGLVRYQKKQLCCRKRNKNKKQMVNLARRGRKSNTIKRKNSKKKTQVGGNIFKDILNTVKSTVSSIFDKNSPLKESMKEGALNAIKGKVSSKYGINSDLF